MPQLKEKPLAELTVNDVTQSYDDAFDAPAKPVAPVKEPAVEVKAEKTPETPDAKPALRRRPDGTFMAPHSPYWLRKAQAVGLGDAEIESMEPDELRQAVGVELQSRGQAVRETESVKPLVETPPPKASIEIKEDDYDPSLAGVLKSIVARLDAIDSREAERQQRGMLNRLDRKFDEHKEIFGAGPTEKLDPNSPGFLKRQLVIQGFGLLAQAGQKTTFDDDSARLLAAFGAGGKPAKPRADDDEHIWNQPNPPRKRVEPSEEPPAGRNRLTREDEWEAGTVEKPTHRNKPELPKGPVKAKQTFLNGVRDIEEKRAVSGEPDENDELPG